MRRGASPCHLLPLPHSHHSLRTGATFLSFTSFCPVYQRFSTINFLGLFKIHIYIVLNGFSLIIPSHF